MEPLEAFTCRSKWSLLKLYAPRRTSFGFICFHLLKIGSLLWPIWIDLLHCNNNRGPPMFLGWEFRLTLTDLIRPKNYHAAFFLADLAESKIWIPSVPNMTFYFQKESNPMPRIYVALWVYPEALFSFAVYICICIWFCLYSYLYFDCIVMHFTIWTLNRFSTRTSQLFTRSIFGC